MCNEVSLAAVSPVANGLHMVLQSTGCPKPVTDLVAVRPVTSLSEVFEEHEVFCNEKERWYAMVKQHARCLTNVLERDWHAS